MRRRFFYSIIKTFLMRFIFKTYFQKSQRVRDTSLFALILGLAVSCSGSEQQAARPPLMGWSSWNAFTVNISDSIIRHQADLLVERGLKGGIYSDAGHNNVRIADVGTTCAAFDCLRIDTKY